MKETKFFTPLLFLSYWIRDPKSGIWHPGRIEFRIRDKHPGSAKLNLSKTIPDSDPGYFYL
jgi:hypothetical protein